MQPEKGSGAKKSRLQTIYGIVGIVLFVLGLFLAYEGVLSWRVSPAQWNEGVLVAVLVILLLYGTHEYLDR